MKWRLVRRFVVAVVVRIESNKRNVNGAPFDAKLRHTFVDGLNQ